MRGVLDIVMAGATPHSFATPPPPEPVRVVAHELAPGARPAAHAVAMHVVESPAVLRAMVEDFRDAAARAIEGLRTGQGALIRQGLAQCAELAFALEPYCTCKVSAEAARTCPVCRPLDDLGHGG